MFFFLRSPSRRDFFRGCDTCTK